MSFRFLLGVGVVALVCLMALSSVLCTPREWSDTVAWARDWRRVRGERVAAATRPWGEVVPGSPREGYAVACRLAEAVSVDEEALRDVLEGKPSHAGVSERVAVALASLAPAIAALRAATHRVGDGAAVDCELGQGDAAGVLALLPLVDGLLVASGGKAEHEPGAAVAGMLDALVCGADFAVGTLSVSRGLGCLIVDRSLAAVDDALLQRCDAAVLGQLAEALARADAVLSSGPAVVTDMAAAAVLMAAERTDLRPEDLGMISPLQAWRDGFSVRRSAIARASRLVDVAQRFAAATPVGESWAARRARLDALPAEDLGGELWLARGGRVHFVVQSEEELRRALADVRLLRLAVAFHGGQDLSLADPLGDGPLRVESAGARATFASVAAGLSRTAQRAH